MADDSAPPPAAAIHSDAAVSTPYLVQLGDGSTTTYYVHTDRAPTQGEVAQYAQSQGQTFAGFPTPAPQPAPAPAAAAPAPEAPSYAQRAWGVIAPHRSFLSQLPSVGGAVGGGMYGAAAGAPLGPPGMIVGGLVGAGLGGAAGEAAQYGGEKLLEAQPAEAGTFGQRVVSAGIRGTVGEALGAPVRFLGLVPTAAARPVGEAAAELAPVLTGTAERVVAPEGAGAARQLAAEAANRLPDWWAANAAGKTPGEVLKAWNALEPEAQALIAGEHLPAMQTVMGQLTAGAAPWSQTLGKWGIGGVAGAPGWILAGHPTGAILSGAVPAYDVAAQAGNKLLASALTSPTGARVLSWLPTAANVAGPIFGGATRAVAQPIAAEQWPPATTVWPASP